MGIQVQFKGGNTIRSLLEAPKDKDNIIQKSRVIYRYKCNRFECDKEYTGSMEGPLMKHFRPPSPIYDYASTLGHHTRLDSFSILGRESHTLK